MASVSPGDSDSYLEELHTQTKNRTKLREKGGLRYTIIRKAVLVAKVEAVGANTVGIALGQGERQQWLMQKCQIECLNGMDAGVTRTPKIDTSKIR